MYVTVCTFFSLEVHSDCSVVNPQVSFYEREREERIREEKRKSAARERKRGEVTLVTA